MRSSTALLASLCTLAACNLTAPREVTGVVVDEHGAPVSQARVIVGYSGWAWDPYLVWDHFYSVETATDPGGRFRVDLTAPERLSATVESGHGAIRSVSVSANEDLRLVTPAAGPACRCWSYSSPMFLAQARIGDQEPLSTANAREERRISTLPHRFRVERSSDNPRQITLTVLDGDSSDWFPEDGIYGGMLDYHPPLERFDYRSAPRPIRLGQANGVVVLRTDDAYLVLQMGTGYATQSAGDGGTVESLLLPARWAEPSD